MDSIDPWLLVSRWFHIAAAIVTLGGATFMLFALLPGAKECLSTEDHERLRDVVRKRWSKLVYVSIVILFLTGGFNFVRLALPMNANAIPYHPIFGVKFLAALAVFFLGSALVGSAPGLAKMRQSSRKWLGILLSLGALIILLSGLLGQIRTG